MYYIMELKSRLDFLINKHQPVRRKRVYGYSVTVVLSGRFGRMVKLRGRVYRRPALQPSGRPLRRETVFYYVKISGSIKDGNRESGRTKGGTPTLVEDGHSVDMVGGSSVLIELSNH